MAKTRVAYVCQECGAVSPRWAGRCPECEAWNSIAEEAVFSGAPARHATGGASPRPITDGGAEPPARLVTGTAEFDRVLGGGIVPGSLVLLGGDPGIGKSTLMLQVSHQLARGAGRVLYVSGEESHEQTRLRARRLGALHETLLLLTETSVDAIVRAIRGGEFACVVVDSIQSTYAPDLPAVPGSVSQVRESANALLRVAKQDHVPVFLVGHVTKEGQIAGPRLLEHLVDTVLYFEGEGKQALRILRAVKNRFGSTNEIGVFEMRDSGLHEVPNPSAWFLSERPEDVSGSVVLPSIEGTRPVLVEVQALVGDAHAGSPRRAVTGVAPGRVSLILAVLEKRAGLHLSDRDVFVNVAGGVRLDEPAADLAVALAIASSFMDRPVAGGVAAFGEIGLAGEARAVDQALRRASEAVKFGFSRVLLPKSCVKDAASAGGELSGVSDVAQALEWALER